MEKFLRKTRPDLSGSAGIAILRPGSIVSFVGGGGKTSALFSLARRQRHPVLLTTTTKVGFNQVQTADRILPPRDFLAEPEIAGESRVIWVSELPENGETRKISGISSADFTELARRAARLGYSILIEADGAHRRSIKAPETHEPVIPPETTAVAACIGLSVLGQPATDESVHRLVRYLDCVGGQPGDIITEDSILRLVAHPEGSFKSTPDSAERILLLNQADNAALLDRALKIADRALSAASADRVWITRLNRGEWLCEMTRTVKKEVR